ncbi:MAG: transposase, partial [Chlamydiota bacterium]
MFSEIPRSSFGNGYNHSLQDLLEISKNILLNFLAELVRNTGYVCTKAVFPSVKWQRCLFHLSQNAMAYAPSKGLKKEIAGAVRDIYQAMDKEEA